MSEFCDLKNKEALAILEDLETEDICDIHNNLHPSYLLRNVMLCAMAVLDYREDYTTVSCKVKHPKLFINSLKKINY